MHYFIPSSFVVMPHGSCVELPHLVNVYFRHSNLEKVVYFRLSVQPKSQKSREDGFTQVLHHRRCQRPPQHDRTQCGFPGQHEGRRHHRLRGGLPLRTSFAASQARYRCLHHRSPDWPVAVQWRLWDSHCFHRPHLEQLLSANLFVLHSPPNHPGSFLFSFLPLYFLIQWLLLNPQCSFVSIFVDFTFCLIFVDVLNLI